MKAALAVLSVDQQTLLCMSVTPVYASLLCAHALLAVLLPGERVWLGHGTSTLLGAGTCRDVVPVCERVRACIFPLDPIPYLNTAMRDLSLVEARASSCP